MNNIYLDNAATTFIDKQVAEFVYRSMLENDGNPSSSHQFGRKAKTAVEDARRNIAKHLNCLASEIIFTSGGTESNNLILHNAVANLKVKTIITSKIEHHAVLRTVQYLKKTHNIEVIYLNTNSLGVIDLTDLQDVLTNAKEKTLVSLMYINNEIGNISPVDKISEICKKHDALFHSDTVQAVGSLPIDLRETPIDFMVASAHKFHGPNGVGFAYFKKGHRIQSILHGGNQERGARSGTENVHSIMGMDKALEKASKNFVQDTHHLMNLKKYFINQLKHAIPQIAFNGLSDDLQNSSHKILNVRFPTQDDMLLFHLDLAGIAVSGGSACQSGSNGASHVIEQILDGEEATKTSIRFSFSKNNTEEEIDRTVEVIQNILEKN